MGFGRCKLHGGCAPSGRKAAQRLMAEEAVVEFGLLREIDPQTALLEEVHRTAGRVAWLAGVLAERGDDALIDAELGRSEWVRLEQEERAHLVKVCAAAISAGVAELQVRVAQAQAAEVVQLLRGVLADLGVGADPRVPEVVSRHLRLLAGGS